MFCISHSVIMLRLKHFQALLYIFQVVFITFLLFLSNFRHVASPFLRPRYTTISNRFSPAGPRGRESAGPPVRGARVRVRIRVRVRVRVRIRIRIRVRVRVRVRVRILTSKK